MKIIQYVRNNDQKLIPKKAKLIINNIKAKTNCSEFPPQKRILISSAHKNHRRQIFTTELFAQTQSRIYPEFTDNTDSIQN